MARTAALNTARMLPAIGLLAVSLVSCGSDETPDAAAPAARVTTSPATQTAPATSEAAHAAPSSASAPESAAATTPVGEAAAATSAPPAKAGSGSNPCDLLTEAEVSKALGAKVTAEFIDHGPPLGGKQCLWASASVPVRNYSLTISRTEDFVKQIRDIGQTGTKLYTQSKELYGASEPVSGIGDEAVYVKSNVLARKGDVFIAASCMFGTSPEAVAALKSLTKTAVDKI